MDDNIVDILKDSSWFQTIPKESLIGLAQTVIQHSLDKDGVLIQKGDVSDSVFYIYAGWVKIVAGDALGGEVVLNHLGPGEYVGELSLIDQKPRSASVIGLSPIKALEIKRKDFLEVLDHNPSIALGIIANISSRMRFSSTYVEKAIQWSHDVAKGDYTFATDQLQNSSIIDSDNSDEDRAGRFLDAFYRMVQGIMEREQDLKQQLYELTIEIDQAKRDEEIDAIIESEIFKKIKDGTKDFHAESVSNKI